MVTMTTMTLVNTTKTVAQLNNEGLAWPAWVTEKINKSSQTDRYSIAYEVTERGIFVQTIGKV